MGENQHCQAAFINAIREEGTKDEACDWLQKIWNELCAVRSQALKVIAADADYRSHIEHIAPEVATDPLTEAVAELKRVIEP